MTTLPDLLKEIAAGQIPAEIPADCDCQEELKLLVDYLADIARFVRAMSAGDLSATIYRRGSLAGSLKALHANLRHLSWQTQQVAAGDFEQRVDFLGDFSAAFNSMVVSLNQAREDMIAKNQQLAEAFDELKTTQAQLLQQAKMASVGQLAAGVAHEINNPMGFITSNLNTLRDYGEALATYITAVDQVAASRSDEQSAALAVLRKRLDMAFLLEDMPELIEESVSGATRVRDIVLALKRFSNVDQAAVQQANINDCLENTIAAAGNTLSAKATLIRDYAELPAIFCNPQELGQLFLNLLLNAAQAIPHGGEIKITTHCDAEMIYASIADNGEGMAEDIIARIFEPFFTTRPVGTGTGLGLAIAYDIVKKHHGRIEVESTPGVGSQFTVLLPLCDSESAANGT